MSKKSKKHYYLNDAKLRVTVTIENHDRGAVATAIVEHLETSLGYTTASHAVFKDFYKRSIVGEKASRVTKKVIEHWDTLLDTVYENYLPQIQQQYPNS